jgi:hypothetical protein
MNFRTTALLFGLLLTMLLVFGIVVQVPRGAVDKSALFPDIADTPSLAIETVVLERGGKQIRLVKSGRGWQLQLPTGNQATRADETRVEDIIAQVRRARKDEETKVPQKLAQVGLEPPAARVILKEQGAGREWTLNIGDLSEDKNFVYVTSSHRPRSVVAVEASSLDSLFPRKEKGPSPVDNPNELRSRTLLDVTDFNANSILLQQPGGKDRKEKTEVALEKTSEGLWIFKTPAQYGAADFGGNPSSKDEPGVRGLLGALAVRVDSAGDFEPLGKGRLEDYGLAPGQESMRIEVEHSPGGFGPDKDKRIKQVLLVGAKAGKDQYYVRLDNDDGVARVSAAKLEPAFRVARDPAILRSRDLTTVTPAAVDAAEVSWGAGPKKDFQNKLELLKEDATLWWLHTDGQYEKANATAVAGDEGSLLSTMKGQGKVEEFFPATTEKEATELDAKLGLNNPVAEVKLYIGGLEKKKEEADETGKDKDKKEKKEKKEARPTLKKDARPAVTVTFGKTEKDKVYVKRASDKLGISRVAVPASILEKIAPPEGTLAYLETAVPTFREGDVTKLELERPDGKFVVEKLAKEDVVKEKPGKADEAKEKPRKDAPSTWRLLEPKDLPDRTTASLAKVNEVLSTLAKLKMERWVRRIDPKDAKALAEFGLEPPSLSARVTLKTDDDKKTEVLVYKFGKEVEDEKTKGVYALLNKKDIVFLAQPVAVKVMRDAELRDRSIFAFDPGKIKELKMVGWFETAKYQFELLLERKSAGVWVAPKLKGFDVNNKLVGDFVRLLSTLEAKKFVQFKGKAPAEYKLAADDPNLKIDVKMEDGKTTYSLTVGAANKDKIGYYASASPLPGVIFLLPREPFDPVLANYSHFSRTKK